MCPVCLTTAALIACGITSAGGLTAIAIRKFGTHNAIDNSSRPTPSEPLEK
jgi:hypothetical protein